MKLLKKFVWLLASVALVSCGGDDDDNTPSVPALVLNQANLAGTYTLGRLVGQGEESTTLSSGTSVVVSTTEDTGSAFDGAAITLAADGTYTTTGSYVLTTLTTVEGETTDGTDIINLGSNGTYAVDTDASTLTFTVVEAGLEDVIFEGSFDVLDFDEDELELFSDTSVEDGSNIITNSTTYSFTR